MSKAISCAVVVLLLVVCARAVIPEPDFELVRSLAEKVTSSGSRFILAEKIRNNSTVPRRQVIDVRQNADFCAGHIPGAINIPYGKVLTKEGIAMLPVNQPLAVVCYTGQSAAVITSLLSILGYDAVDMSFGMASWNAATEVNIFSAAQTQTIRGGAWPTVKC